MRAHRIGLRLTSLYGPYGLDAGNGLMPGATREALNPDRLKSSSTFLRSAYWSVPSRRTPSRYDRDDLGAISYIITYLNGVELNFSRPGKPTDNAMIEAFNARLGRNVSTKAGSCLWKMLGRKSRGGARSTPREIGARLGPCGHGISLDRGVRCHQHRLCLNGGEKAPG